jgi:methyl-accepting chemotaxis protein
VGPIQQSVAFLKHDFDALDLKSTFALAAPFVTEFAHGLSGIVSEFLPGFNQALVKGKPAIDLFASRLPEIGKDIGDMLSKLAGSEGTLEGVNALFNVLSETIHFVGTSVAWLGDRFHDFNHDADATFSWLSKVTAWLGDDEDSKALKQTADDFKALSDGAQQGAIHFATYAGEAQYATAITAQMGKETSDTTDYMKDFRDAMIASQQAIDDWINKALGLSDANIAVAQDFADLNDKLNRGKRFWDMNTQGGRDNLKLMNDTIGDLERQRLQAIATSDGSRAAIDKINQAFNANIDLLEKQAIKAGDTKAAFEAMAGSYRITIITDILNAAAAAKQSKTDKSSRFAGFASGGTTPAYAPFVVGEHGPEVLWDSKQHYVETKAMAQQSAMPWSGGGSSGGAGGTVTHVIDLQLNGRTIRTLLIGDGTARGVSKVDLADKYP